MKKEDFKIGETFVAGGGFTWLCTDIGTRTITAIMLDPDKTNDWFEGPPYSVEEVVFDEYDMPGCGKKWEDLITDRMEDLSERLHPGFDSEDVFKMMKESGLNGRMNYHRKKLGQRDRVSPDGEIWHPYSAKRTDAGWEIQIFNVFSRKYDSIHENDFIKWKLCQEEDLKAAAEKHSKEG